MHLSETRHNKKNDCRLSRTQVNTVPLKLSLTVGHKKTISAVVDATALIVNGLASGVGESYSLAGWKWS